MAKRSIAMAAVAVSFLLGSPTTEFSTKLATRLWTLYGAYISMWLGQHAAFFLVLCFLCVLVVLAYGVILLPFLHKDKPYEIAVDDVDSVPVHSLKKHFHIIQERVNYNQLLPQLYQDRVLSIEEEIAKIESQPSQAAKTMHLVHMLEKKGKTGVKSFVESLLKDEHNLGHTDLAQELMSEYPEIFPTQTEGSMNEDEMEKEQVTTSDPAIEHTHTKCTPRLHMESVMDVRYVFASDDDPCHQKLISWGLQIFPSQPLTTTLLISTCLVGNYEFPPYYELVSPVFYFWCPETTPGSVKFDMKHSVDAKTRKQATCLSFAAADASDGPPFRFSLLEGGEFNHLASSGVVCTRPQGLLAIVKKKLGRLTLRTDPQIKYKAQVYYTWDTPMEYECTVHFVVTPATKAWERVVEHHFRDAISGDAREVSFNKTNISLTVPEEGLFVKGWSITCTSQKTINCDAVAKATDQLIIPECQLSIKWVGGGSGNEDLLPSDLHCNVSFTGSHQKRSESFVHLHVRCNQGKQLVAGMW